jgi:hypothetical protein
MYPFALYSLGREFRSQQTTAKGWQDTHEHFAEQTHDFHSDVTPSPFVSPLIVFPIAKYFWWKEFLSNQLRVRGTSHFHLSKNGCVRRKSRHTMGGLKCNVRIVSINKQLLDLLRATVCHPSYKMFPLPSGLVKGISRVTWLCLRECRPL